MDLDEQQAGNLFSWEKQYQKSWDVIQEDEDGTLSTAIQQLMLRHLHTKRIRCKSTDTAEPVQGPVKRGIIRHLFLVIDASRSSLEEIDFHPTRFACILRCLESSFIRKFFQQNCLAQLGIVALRNGIGEKVCDLTSDPTQLIQSLHQYAKSLTESESSFGRENFPSLMNGLQIACKNLFLLGSGKSCLFGEIVVLYGSIFTIDPGNLLKWAEETLLKGPLPVRLSFVGMAGEMQIAKTLASMTHGEHLVPLSDYHIKDFLNEYAIPLKDEFETRVCRLLPVGFPLAQNTCPRCHFPMSKEIPTECEICSLLLVSNNHLSRSFGSLFIVNEFEPIEQVALTKCSGCNEQIAEPMHYKCKRCEQTFCSSCDSLIHDSLQVCPGCCLHF